MTALNKEYVRIRLWFGLTVAAIWAYVDAVFLVDGPFLPMWSGGLGWLASTALAFLLGNSMAKGALRRQTLSAQQLLNVCLFGTVLIAGVIVVDVTYSFYLNSTASTAGSRASRVIDRNSWVGELYPKRYYPTERNFMLHKPNTSVSGILYGYFYRKPMEDSPTLVRSVLERRPITIRINDLGFRESTPIREAEVFTLGDSFTFGWGVDESEAWPDLLETAIGKPLYNLGIHDASPKQELELLKYVLHEQRGEIRVRKLLWMIFESNDLEEDYSELHRESMAEARPRLTEGTLIEAVLNVPRILKRQSVIHRIRSGAITWRTSFGRQPPGSYSVDGVELARPLFFSETLGPRLFSPQYVKRVTRPRSYVLEHPNRERLEAVFRDMKSLADEYGFEVTVIIAPGATRLHGPYFEGFPEISAKPYFIDFVEELTRSTGFESVNLYRLMQPYAESELLFFRDDDHFNHRGNALAAELIYKESFAGRN